MRVLGTWRAAFVLAVIVGAAVAGADDAKAAPGYGIWSQAHGTVYQEYARGVATTAFTGDVVVVGEISGPIDFGGGTLVPAGSSDIFLMRRGGSGFHQWSKRFGGVGAEIGSSVAVDGSAAGNTYIAGYLTFPVDFGGGNVAGTVYLAKFDQLGGHFWSKAFNTNEVSYSGRGPQIAVDASGNVVMTGFFTGTVDFGGGPLTSSGSGDIYVAKFNSAGTHLWSKRFGDSFHQVGVSVAVDGSGNVILAGNLDGSADFGGGTVTSNGHFDAFVVKLDASGAHLWTNAAGSVGTEAVTDVAADGNNNVLLTGVFSGALNFGGGQLVASTLDMYVVKFNSAGSHQWSKSFEGFVAGTRIAADGAGNVLLTGEYRDVIDLGGGPLPSVAERDVFAATFDASGAHLWSRSFGALGIESDGDGCPDAKETGPDHTLGGQRNPANFWDFYDVNGSLKIDSADIGLVRSNWNPSGPVPPEDVIYDRSPGAATWAPGPPDGKINGIDIGLIRVSFNDSCRNTGASYYYDIAADRNGAAFVVGDFGEPISFGGPTLSGSGAPDIYVAKLDGVPQ